MVRMTKKKPAEVTVNLSREDARYLANLIDEFARIGEPRKMVAGHERILRACAEALK